MIKNNISFVIFAGQQSKSLSFNTSPIVLLISCLALLSLIIGLIIALIFSTQNNYAPADYAKLKNDLYQQDIKWKETDLEIQSLSERILTLIEEDEEIEFILNSASKKKK